MTCVCAIVEGGHVIMGADTQGTGGYSKQLRTDVKVFTRGKFLIGFTSSYRMGQILRYCLNVREQYSSETDYQYMVTTFIDAVRECLKTAGYAKTVNGEESGGTFLVAYKSNLYLVDEDYQVATMKANYAAVGCGDDIALGSLFSTDGRLSRDRIRIALEAASTFSAGVGGEFTIMSTEGTHG